LTSVGDAIKANPAKPADEPFAVCELVKQETVEEKQH
jgi:hypothetical protein